jgi:formylglycine-generating enzyme required for sulfatase activity
MRDITGGYMANWKIYTLIAVVMTAAGFGYVKSTHRNIPSDLRDAVANDGKFDTSIPMVDKSKSNIPEPSAARVEGITKGYVEPVEPATPIEWVPISGGKFRMGATVIGEAFGDDKRGRKVTIETFAMSKTDVTVAQYDECVIKRGCTEPDTGGSCNWGKAGRRNHPVNCVDWNQAKKYAQFISKQPGFEGARLPTESEWEYAATSGGRHQKFPWGDDKLDSELAVFNTNSTMPVCSKPRGNTAQGLCDMSGNVWQWVQDTYRNSYAGAPVDGRAVEGTGSFRVLRGGSFNCNDAGYLRADYRYGGSPGYRGINIGFRVAR